MVLIDGHSILNRAFYGVPDLTNSKGQHTNAVYGFLNIMFKILEEEKTDYLVVAFDVKQPTFRHKMYEAYKGTRKPMPEELREQVPMIKEVLTAMNISIVELPGYEADDILGTLAVKGEQAGLEVSLVSGDRDLLQLASEKIKIRIPKTKRGTTEIEDYHTEDVIEKYGITPKQIIDLKGLMGDTADNIPGVPGIGEKTAVKILTQFQSVEGALEHIEEVMPNKARQNLKEFEEKARLSKELATINTDSPVELEIETATIENIYNENAYKVLKTLEFKSILSRFDNEVSRDSEVETCFSYITKQKEAAKIIKEIDKIVNQGKASEQKKAIEKLKNINEEKAGKREKNSSQGKSSSQEKIVLGVGLFEKNSGIKKSKTTGKNKITEEQDGQLSLFSTDIEQEERFEERFLGISVAYKNPDLKVCYFSMEKDIESKSLIEAVRRWKETAVISVFDLKLYLEKLKKYSDENLAEEYLESSKQKEFFDCSVAGYLLNPLKESYQYDDIARDYLNMTIPSYTDLFGKLSYVEAEKEKKEDFVQYACYQAYVALAAKEVLEEELEKAQMKELFEEVEMPLVYTLFEMEQRGVRVNKEELKSYGQRLETRINEIEQQIYEAVGEQFNINSPKQLGSILFEKMQLPFAKKTKTGYSTSADILDKLKDDYPVVADILEYRQLTKLKSTYADGLSHFIEEDGRIHGKFNQTITATGRLSSTEPNLQNIPIRMEIGKEIRKVFIPKEGYVFLDADYSQIELRILAHMSGDEQMIQAYREEQDIHKITASQVFHIPLEEVTPLQRSNAKAVNFGIVYGISSFGLGQDLNISKKEAEGYIKKYFATYPKIKEFLDGLVQFGKEKGYVVSLMNRKRQVPELSSSNFMQRSFGERIAMNSPIQGTAADIIKIAMVRVNRRLKEEKLESQLLLQVHDELLVETKIEEKEQVKKILEEEMFHAMELKVPLEVDVQEGENWYEAH